MPETPWISLFRCPACKTTPSRASFPLCSACSDDLRPCPQICANCGGFHPHAGANPDGPCPRPWRSIAPLAQIHASYLAIGRTHRVLKAWKRQGGWAFDQRVLRIPNSIRRNWDSIVPIPQSLKRSWSLGRSPAHVAAQFAARELGAPLLLCLDAPREASTQAQTPLAERLTKKIEWRRGSARVPRSGRILLVDDWVTTGRTLRSAGQALLDFAGGAAGGSLGLEIHAWALGLRPPRVTESDQGQLASRLAEPEAVGQEDEAVRSL